MFSSADYSNSGVITRQALRVALDEFKTESEMLFKIHDKPIVITQDPVISRVMNVLEVSDQGLISQFDVVEAIKVVVQQSGKIINEAQTNAFIQEIFLLTEDQ